MIRNVIWDWNGTLLDDVEASLVSVNDMLDSFSIPRITLATYYTYVDTPISRFYEHLFDLEKMPMSRLAPMFRERMTAHADRIGLMDHARETIAELADSGIRQWIISSAREESILRDLEMFGIRDFFVDVLGESNDYAGSKIERAVAYFHSHDLQGSESLVIGDTLHDLELADALAARCLLFANGHQGKEILQGHGTPVLDSLEELLPYVRQASE